MNMSRCNKCGFKTTLSRVMWQHRKIFHPTTYSHGYRCSLCSKSLKTAKALKEHKVNHVKKRQYACTTCYKVFNYKGVMNRHLNIHKSNVGTGTGFSQTSRENITIEENSLSPADLARNKNIMDLMVGFETYSREQGDSEEQIKRCLGEIRGRLTTCDPRRFDKTTNNNEKLPVLIEEEVPDALKEILAPGTKLYVVAPSHGKKNQAMVDAEVQVDWGKTVGRGRKWKLLSCPKCDYTTNRDTWTLNRHDKSQHQPGNMMFECPRYWCEEAFITQHERNEHKDMCKKYCEVEGCTKEGMVWRKAVTEHSRYHTAKFAAIEKLRVAYNLSPSGDSNLPASVDREDRDSNIAASEDREVRDGNLAASEESEEREGRDDRDNNIPTSEDREDSEDGLPASEDWEYGDNNIPEEEQFAGDAAEGAEEGPVGEAADELPTGDAEEMEEGLVAEAVEELDAGDAERVEEGPGGEVCQPPQKGGGPLPGEQLLQLPPAIPVAPPGPRQAGGGLQVPALDCQPLRGLGEQEEGEDKEDNIPASVDMEDGDIEELHGFTREDMIISKEKSNQLRDYIASLQEEYNNTRQLRN